MGERPEDPKTCLSRLRRARHGTPGITIPDGVLLAALGEQVGVLQRVAGFPGAVVVAEVDSVGQGRVR